MNMFIRQKAEGQTDITDNTRQEKQYSTLHTINCIEMRTKSIYKLVVMSKIMH